MDTVLLNGTELRGATVPTPHTTLLMICAQNGFLGCGYLNIATAEKVGDAVLRAESRGEIAEEVRDFESESLPEPHKLFGESDDPARKADGDLRHPATELHESVTDTEPEALERRADSNQPAQDCLPDRLQNIEYLLKKAHQYRLPYQNQSVVLL